MITLLLLGAFAAASAQSSQSICGTRSVAFRCPMASWATVVRSGGVEGLFVTKGDPPQEIGLFALEIEGVSADERSPNELLDRVFELLYSRRLSDFQLKESKEFRNVRDWRYSRFEEKRYQKVAFDDARNEMLHTHVVVISADGKRIMAGFVRSFLTGDLAKQAFEGWTMGSGSGPDQLRILINSITKEENGGERRQPRRQPLRQGNHS